MASVTIQYLSDETRRARELQATTHNGSVEAEIHAILEAAM